VLQNPYINDTLAKYPEYLSHCGIRIAVDLKIVIALLKDKLQLYVIFQLLPGHGLVLYVTE
jgi:hypothetical protein